MAEKELGSGTKVLASQLSLDCRARRSGWVGSTTLISSAFAALLNCAEVGRRKRILTPLDLNPDPALTTILSAGTKVKIQFLLTCESQG